MGKTKKSLAYGLLRGLRKLRFYSKQMREVMNDSHPWGEWDFRSQSQRWAPLNRGIGSRAGSC